MWFPDKNDPELERLADIIHELRTHIFLREVRRDAPEREWETKEQEQRRNQQNEEAQKKWINETRRLILGELPDGD